MARHSIRLCNEFRVSHKRRGDSTRFEWETGDPTRSDREVILCDPSQKTPHPSTLRIAHDSRSTLARTLLLLFFFLSTSSRESPFYLFAHTRLATRALQVAIEFSDFTTERFEDITPSVKLIQIILDNIDRDCTMSVYRKRERTLLFVLVLLLARNNNYERKKNTVNVVQCRS